MVSYNIHKKHINMGRNSNLLDKAKDKNHTLVQNVRPINASSRIHDKVMKHEKHQAPSPLNLRNDQMHLLAKQEKYDSFASDTVVASILSKDNDFRIRVNPNDVEVIKRVVLDLEIFNPSADTDLAVPTFIHDFLKTITISVKGVTAQTINVVAMFLEQRGLQIDQAQYDNTYKDGILCGADLAFGTSRHLYLPIDCVLTMNEIYAPALDNDITFTISTRASGWPGVVPELKSCNLIIVHDDYAREQERPLALSYANYPLDFKFWEAEVQPVALKSVTASTTVKYQLAGVSGIINSLAFVMKPSTSSNIDAWATDYIESFSILDSSGTRIHGNVAISREFYETVILHDRQHVRLIDTNAHDTFLALDFGNYAQDIKTGNNSGFEVFDGKHWIEITYASGTPSADYELDVVCWHTRSLRIAKGGVSVEKAS